MKCKIQAIFYMQHQSETSDHLYQDNAIAEGVQVQVAAVAVAVS
jgi:hypothetical protein